VIWVTTRTAVARRASPATPFFWRRDGSRTEERLPALSRDIEESAVSVPPSLLGNLLLRPRYVSVHPRPGHPPPPHSLSLSLSLSLAVFPSTSTTLRRFDGRKITNLLVLRYLALLHPPHPLSRVTRSRMQLRGARRRRVVSRGEIPRRLRRGRESPPRRDRDCALKSAFYASRERLSRFAPIHALVSRDGNSRVTLWRCEIGIKVSGRLMRARALPSAQFRSSLLRVI